jgi:cyclin E
MLNYLVSTEGIYSPDPNYFERCQPDVSNMMRAILLDWMMEVCNEFTLKRETFYYALNYVDRFMSVHKNIRKEELQLLGVTSMFMAAKMEEVFSPRVADFAKSTDNGYDVTQIVKMEKLMLKDLGWRTTPPTYAMWANWYMNQWDIYISTNEYAMNHEVIQRTPDLTFKTSNETAYARFREVMQIVDLVVLDYSHLQYKPRGLIASILFIILGIHVGEFDIQRI